MSKARIVEVGIAIGKGRRKQTNAALYSKGEKYAAHLPLRTAGDRAESARTRSVAAGFGVPPVEVRRAVEFTRTVDRIEEVCGGAKELILSGHPRLPVPVVMSIGRTHPDRQRFALALAKEGRNPLGKPSAGIEPPFDTTGYSEVFSRQARTAGLLDHVADGLLGTPRKKWPVDTVIRKIERDAMDVLKDCRRNTLLGKSAGGRYKEARIPWKDRAAKTAFYPSTAKGKVASVRGISAKNTRDLPRLFREQLPTRAEANAVVEGEWKLRRSAERLTAVLRTRGRGPRVGPLPVPGTYVVFYRIDEHVPALKVGELGKSDFRPGIYAYLGSAFAVGGVRKRTHRHLTKDSPKKKWNIDFLKPYCTPVAVWCTHERAQVEFDWAAPLGALPGGSFPVTGFGERQNPNAPSHLVRFDRMPSIKAFRRSVAKAMKGHAPVHEKVVEDWTGHGWAK